MKLKVAAGLLGLGLCIVGARAEGPALGICVADEQVPAATRSDIQRLATDFAQKLARHDVAGAFESLSNDALADAKENKSDDKITGLLDQIGVLRDVKLEHIYFADIGGVGLSVSLNCPQGYGVAALPSTPNTYAVLSAQTDDYAWTLSLWFETTADGWRVRNLSINNSGANGKTAADFATLARSERKAGHLFNAYFLYRTAALLTKRGDILRLSLAEQLDPEIAAFPPPAELRGSAPYQWTMNARTYTVGSFNVFSADGKQGLLFELPNQSWTSDDNADAKCRAFLDDFRAAHPEWRAVFAKLRVQLIAPDHKTTFSRSYTEGSGYDVDNAPQHA